MKKMNAGAVLSKFADTICSDRKHSHDNRRNPQHVICLRKTCKNKNQETAVNGTYKEKGK